MGFEKQTGSGNGLYFVVKHHTICRESKNEREGFEPIEVTNPQTNERSLKYIERYKRLSGMITKIEFRDTADKYEQRYVDWAIHITDENGAKGILTIGFNTGASSRLMKVAPNLDFARPVEFRAWKDTSGKVPKTAFFIGQGHDADGKIISVPQRYTKDKPGEMPKAKERMGGKKDFSDQTEWLYNQMINVIIPKVEAVASVMQTSSNAPSAREPGDDTNEPPFDDTEQDDDVPF